MLIRKSINLILEKSGSLANTLLEYMTLAQSLLRAGLLKIYLLKYICFMKRYDFLFLFLSKISNWLLLFNLLLPKLVDLFVNTIKSIGANKSPESKPK